jgi:transcriptional regulator with XRE-family HTH domain
MAESLPLLITRAMRTLSLSQEALGQRVIASRKTVGRWQTGMSTPGVKTMAEIADLVVPHDRELALALVDQFNATSSPAFQVPRERFLPEVPPAAKPKPVEPHKIEAVLFAAADAVDQSPRAVRAVLHAAFTRAAELGVTPTEVADFLAPRARPSKRAPTSSAPPDALPAKASRPNLPAR